MFLLDDFLWLYYRKILMQKWQKGVENECLLGVFANSADIIAADRPTLMDSVQVQVGRSAGSASELNKIRTSEEILNLIFLEN